MSEIYVRCQLYIQLQFFRHSSKDFTMAYNDGYGFSELECKIIRAQIERRAKFRQEFMRMRSNPCPHDAFVFDPAVQRFLSMKVTGLEFFQVNASSVKFGIFALLLPMASYGYLIWSQRMQLERDIRCGKIKYRDRIHKFK